MKFRFHIVLVISLAAMFLAGCSIRTVPLEEEQLVYENEVEFYDSLPPSFFYDAWQLSQYRQYYGDVSELDYRMHIDPNPHDSYRAYEKPVQRAPAQRSIQGTTSNRRVGERQDYLPIQRTINRSHYARSNHLASESIDNRPRVRERLRQCQRTTNTEDDEDRKAQRRITRRRARR